MHPLWSFRQFIGMVGSANMSCLDNDDRFTHGYESSVVIPGYVQFDATAYLVCQIAHPLRLYWNKQALYARH